MQPAERLERQTITSGPSPFAFIARWLRGITTPTVPMPAPEPPTLQPELKPLSTHDLYRQRKRNLPYNFTAKDWHRALEYWGYCCAVCGRPRGLWHTISQDHWIPVTSPECPGTLSTNMLPLCYGTDGCNNSKGAKPPILWLEEKLGKRRAAKKLQEIEAYFAWIRDLATPQDDLVEMVKTCPACNHVLDYLDEFNIWCCNTCQTEWQEVEEVIES